MVDSGVWIAYFNGVINDQTDALNYYLADDEVLVGDLILTEVLQGFRIEREYRTAKRLLSILPGRDLVGVAAAIRAADAYRLLRQRGITIRKTIDVIIASYCVENRLPLLHDDRDFTLMAPTIGLIEVV